MVKFWKYVIFLIVAAFASLSLAGASESAPLDAPTVLLTIEIQNDGTENNHKIQMTLEDLSALPVTEITTTTNWTNGVQRFSGVWLHTILQTLEVETGVLVLQAINDYRVSIPVAEVTPNGPLVSFARNGKAMTARDNGPLWLVYDYDSNPAFRTETIYSRSIWQLDRITITR